MVNKRLANGKAIIFDNDEIVNLPVTVSSDFSAYNKKPRIVIIYHGTTCMNAHEDNIS